MIEISKLLSKYLFLLAMVMVIPLGFAAFCQFVADPAWHPQPHATAAFGWAVLICLVVAAVLRYCGRSATGQLHRRREGILLVVLIWIVTSLTSALPFCISGTLGPLNSYFEAMSGLTTTGATLLCPKAYGPDGEEVPLYITNPHVPDRTYRFYGTVPPIRDPDTGLVLYSGIEATSRSILLWRSLLQWIGGLGIIVIFLTVLPALHVGGKFLYQVETSGPIKEGITPRIRSTATRLWRLYLVLTLLEIPLLLFTNKEMPLFDAVCISLSNVSTGGFSVRNDSLASYHSFATECIVFVFMLAGSINFALYFHAFRMKFKKIAGPDFFLFIAAVLAGCLFVSLTLLSSHSIGNAFRLGSFQAVSMQTSTGFVLANYDEWPFTAQMFMLLLMFVGGMSGSTTGGIKTSRFYILYKIIQHRLESIYRPDSVRTLQIGSSEIDDKNALTVLSFFCIVGFCIVVGTSTLILDGIDPESSLGLMACFLNNVGAAFRAAGPTGSFAFLTDPAKILSIFWMLLGRLEYYVVFLLFLPSFWKSR